MREAGSCRDLSKVAKGPRMIRDDIGICPEPPRPPRQKTPWGPIMLLVVVGLVAAYLAGLTGPLAGLAVEFGLVSRAPASRLVGEWASDDDPMFRRMHRSMPEKSWRDAGVYSGDDGRWVRGVAYKIISEDRSGRNLVMAEFVMGADQNLQVKYTVAEDGKSMTREY